MVHVTSTVSAATAFGGSIIWLLVLTIITLELTVTFSRSLSVVDITVGPPILFDQHW